MRYHPSDFDVDESEEDDEVVEVSSGQSSQPPTLTSWKEELGQSIIAIETFGDVAWSKQYHHLVLPGLDVGGTPIPLPLVSPRDAEVIRNACHQAPFGRGDETIIDESVRKTWEVGQEGFNCLNPEWNKFVGSLLGEASVGLGMPHGVQARRYKLLLYDPGSFFKPHKDSEKAPGMIATLVICFPSVHEGGDVHLSHGGEKHTLVTSRSSAYDITALAWYSDVTHEVKEITAGHRLALTYNITLPKDQQNQASAAGLVEQQRALESILKIGHEHHPKGATRIMFPLEHQYSETSLSIDNLKGHDRARVHALWKACASSGYQLLLANITRTDVRFEDWLGDLVEESHCLTYVAALEGFEVASKIGIHPDFVGVDPYVSDRGPDSDDENEGEEYTGNASMPNEYRYHDSVAVIVKNDDLADFLKIRSIADDKVAKNVARLVGSGFSGKNNSPLPNTAINLLRKLVAYPKRRMGETLAEILTISARTGDMNLWDEVFDLAIADFCRVDPIASSYSRAHGFTRIPDFRQNDTANSWKMGCLTPVLSRLASHLNGKHLPCLEGDWDKYLGRLATTFPKLENAKAALESLAVELKCDDMKQSFREWRHSLAEIRFSKSTTRLKAEDSSTIMSLLKEKKSLQWVNEIVLPALKCRADKSFLLTLIPALVDHMGTIHVDIITSRILGGTMAQLKPDVRDLVSIVSSSASRGGQSHWGAQITITVYKESQLARFTTLIRKCMEHGLCDEAAQLMDHCCTNVAEAHKEPVIGRSAAYGAPRAVDNVSYVPQKWAEFFLGDVVHAIQHSGKPAPESFKAFFERLLRHHVLAEIPPYPKKPVGWAHKRMECPINSPGEAERCGNSGTCKELNDFLESTTEQKHSFARAAKLREHIENRLSPDHFKFWTTKSRGGPHTLVVTKLETGHEADVKKHLTNIRNLEKRVRPYRIPWIKEILGDELYAELVLLEKIRTPPEDGAQPVPLVYKESDAAALPGVPAQASGNKRPASGNFEYPIASKARVSNVVDLTEDD
ncbi:hypothetical protein PG989_007048 [Apiospora arundinis]